jgi:hypothetical protein
MPLMAVRQSQIHDSGQVTDSEGAVIANARVLVHWDPSGSTVGLSDNIGIKQDVTVARNRPQHLPCTEVPLKGVLGRSLNGAPEGAP